MIRARAIVDVITEKKPPALSVWRVEVWGDEPHDYSFIYEIRAKTEAEAAMDGLQRFGEDVEKILSQERH